jgi:drug/metabolite transporter (DMT)-like permease
MLIAFFPLIAAAFYGLNYMIIERVVAVTGLTTYYITGTLVFLVMAISHGIIKGEPLSFSFARENPGILLLLIFVSFSGGIAWLLTTYALKNISANYAAFGEISYPLFTVFFTWMFFGARQLDFTTIAGGLLIMAGSFVLVYGQTTGSK